MTPEIKERIEQIRHRNVPEGYKKIEVGIFPCEWTACRLGQLLEFKNGINAEKEKFGQGIKLISVQDILTENPITYDLIRNAVNIDCKQAEKFAVEYGDILFQRSSENYEDAGTSNVYLDSENKAVFSGFVIRGKKIAKYNPIYLNALLRTAYIRKSIIRKAAGAQHVNVGQESLGKICVVLASDEEQHKIAEILTTQDKVIALQEKKIKELQRFKKAWLSMLFPRKGSSVPEKRFHSFSDEWELRKLGEVGNTYTGLSGKTKEDFGHGNGKFITYMNVFSNPISSTCGVDTIEIDNRQNEVQIGDVFFTTSSETPEEVGMSSVLIKKYGKTYLNSFCFGYRPFVAFDLYYLAYMLRSENVRKQIVFLAQGISRYNISKNKMMEINIPIPSLEEQRVIGEYFSKLDNLITLHQRKLDEMRKMKKSLMQLLLTGIVRV